MSKEEEGIYKIGEIEFEGLSVPVYHDKNGKKGVIRCSWGARNPDSYYTGLITINHETSEIIYPDGAIIPQQTEEDRQRIPKFLITELKELSDEFMEKTLAYLDATYKMKNIKR